MAEPAVLAEKIERRFDSVLAVAGVDLSVPEGQIYGFLGPNGAGKSTLVRMLCTLLLPTAGSARVAGYDVASEPQAVRLRIGVALQEAALDDRQTGRELLRLQGRLYGLHTSEIDRRLDDVLQMVDIGDAIDRRVATYSGGMKRRLDVAAALVHNPEVIFLDEPTTGLDPASRVAVWREVRKLNVERGTTIFLTTQYLEEADELADRVGIIADGRIVAEGTPDELKRSIGDDLIVARVEGADRQVAEALREVPGVHHVSVREGEVTLRAPDGAATMLPVAIVFAVTGISRASSLVTDIQGGYFDRLCVTPVRRLALLLGLMVADFTLVVALTIPVLIVGFAVGVNFVTGVAGLIVFVLVAALWGLVFTGLPSAIALNTGNPAAVNTSFVLFFPLAFLTTTFVPKQALSGWLSTIATYNPVTYLLAGLRSLTSSGWDGTALFQALVAVAAVGVLSIGLALAALRGRVRRG